MNHHIEAWEHVKPHLFGQVVEVTRTTPWGFREDRPDIINYSVADFLTKDIQADTILLHILSGEGEDKETVQKAVVKALASCVKLVVLEHSPKHMDVPDIDYISLMLPEHITEDWGRNMLFACSTTYPLILNELSDAYVAKHLNTTFVTPKDEGIDDKQLIYTHTSESPITFDIPEGKVWWVIGGGLAYESMKEDNVNILFDSVLRQVLHCAYRYGVPQWKLERIWEDVAKVVYHHDYKQWRKVKPNGVQPDQIRHLSLQALTTEGDTVYVSTVHKDVWQHLSDTNNIIDAWTHRDTPHLCKS